MKWIGQNIYDYISRFRDDVYLEGISTSTETDMLVVDSNGKVTKRAIDAITVDVSDFMTNGTDNYVLTATGTDAMNAEANLQFNGTTLSQTGGDITLYDAVNDGNPTISLGSSATERGEIKAVYESGAQGLDGFRFTTYTAGSSADDGSIGFYVDESYKFGINDDGVNIVASGNLSIGGVDILTDSSGTTTLNNIDALDATTESTIESAIDTLSNLTAASSLATVGTITTGVWRGTAIANNALDADTAHLTTTQTFSGAKTFSAATGVSIIDSTTSSATEGGGLILASDDGAVMADNHRLGVIEFKGAEDTSSTLSIGARIQAICRDVWDGSNNDADLEFYTTNGTTESKVLTLDSDKLATFASSILSYNTTTSSASQGGLLSLISDDGAAMGDDHRLGAVIFRGAEDGSGTLKTGAKIQAFADAAWSGTENGTRLEFYTMDGDASSELSLTLDSDKVATFAGDVKCQSLRPTAQRQMTYYMFRADIDTTKTYVGLQEADGESSSATNKNLPILAPVAGKLLKVFLRANNDLSSRTLTWRLETIAAGTATSGTPSGTFGTQSGAGCTASSMTTYDFTSSLDAGNNDIAAGDTVQLSIQSDGATANTTYYVTCLWEWDLS